MRVTDSSRFPYSRITKIEEVDVFSGDAVV